MVEEGLQDVKLEVGLLKSEVETRGKQVEVLLQKLDLTTDKLQQLTVQITKLNTRQEEYLRDSSNMNEEFKLLEILFSDKKNTKLQLMLIKELISLLGRVADRAEEAADRVTTLAVKYQN